MKKTFTVEIEVDQVWIDDGFDLDAPRIQRMISDALENELPYSNESERRAVVKQAGRKLP